ncbi:MAG: A24 family peptidase [Spirochaetes bacterium]|jgi:leader peptidase (prepilin peptidase)/N-methyltransferase|nr:A24 family peptidase [Spirochaetota bacterium]
MTNPQIIYVIIIGLVSASFMLALADRHISGRYKGNLRGFLCDRSRCDSCERVIPFYYNIPIIGYIISAGHCPQCKARIPLRYPVSEILGALLALFCLREFGFNSQSLTLFITFAASGAIVYSDIRVMTIPDSLLCVILSAAIFNIATAGFSTDAIYGMLSAGGAFALFLLVFPGSFGGGDLKLAALLGYFTGFQFVIVMLETALLTGTVAGVTYSLISRKGLRIKIPFAPFIVAGYWTAQLYGTEIIMIYHRAFLP